jgi:hypothetical protein
MTIAGTTAPGSVSLVMLGRYEEAVVFFDLAGQPLPAPVPSRTYLEPIDDMDMRT